MVVKQRIPRPVIHSGRRVGQRHVANVYQAVGITLRQYTPQLYDIVVADIAGIHHEYLPVIVYGHGIATQQPLARRLTVDIFAQPPKVGHFAGLHVDGGKHIPPISVPDTIHHAVNNVV